MGSRQTGAARRVREAGAGRAPLRVVLWSPLPPPVGGISRWTERYREAAPRHEIEVRLVDVSPGVDSVDERSRFALGRLPVALRSLLHLWRVLRRDRPQVAHLTSSLFWATARDALAVALCRAYGVPAILQLRSSSQIIRWRGGLPALRRRLLDRALRLPDLLLVLSRELEEYLGAVLPGQRIERIGNMVAPAEQTEAGVDDAVLPPRRAACRVLFVGYRMPLKGLGELAEAVLALPDCELAVVGGPGSGVIDAGAEHRMETALARLREAGRLVETGPVPPDRATRIYREADVFALPTHREGFPNTLLEAMAAGLPCVSCPVGAVPEMLEDGCGVMVPAGDVGALREALAALAREGTRRKELGDRARLRVAERYAEERVMERYRSLYLSLLGRAGSPA